MADNSIFVSYRRIDSLVEAGRLSDNLEARLQSKSVFRDVDDIAPGSNFEHTLTEKLKNTTTVLVLIGSKWLSELNNRLNREEPDYVCIEIATALRLKKKIIPVLLHGVKLPQGKLLPPEINKLAHYQAISFRDESWTQDVARLIKVIGKPYAFRYLLLRLAVVLPLILFAVKLGITQLTTMDGGMQLSLSRWLILGSIFGYGLLEFFVWKKRTQ